MRFLTLASGSRGNATLVTTRATTLLVDCGLGLAELESRLASVGIAPDAIDALLVTHEHGDHIGGVGPFCRRHRVPVFMSTGTWLAARTLIGPVPEERLLSGHGTFAIGDVAVEALPVPHDARDPTQFVFDDGRHRLGVVTDLGCGTPHLAERLSGCAGLVLEFNHDADLLERGSYPPALKRRIAGRLGHLSNVQAAALLRSIDTTRLEHLVLAHLSEQNNTPELARAAASAALDDAQSLVHVAAPDRVGSWLQLD